MSTPPETRRRIDTGPNIGDGLTRAVAGLRDPIRRTTSVLTWITRAAWLVLALGVIAWVVGARGGWVELVVLGAGLLAVLVGCVFFAIGRHPYAVNLRLREGRVVVGERAMGGIDVRNVGTSHVLPARLELPVGPVTAKFALPGLDPGAEHDELFAIPTERRGVLLVGPVRSVRGDPFGLIRRAVQWTEPEDLYVHPRTIRLGSSSAGFLHDLEGQVSREVTNADLSFHALREYVPGDDRRYVHWRSSARVGELMVRQFEETRRTHLVTALSVNDRDYGDPDEFELAISAVGSLGLHTLGTESELTALTQRREIITLGPRPLLDDLTRLESRKMSEGVVELARAVTRDAVRATVAIIACGSTVTPRQIRAAGAVLPAGVRALAIQCRIGAEVRAHRLGAVTVLELGTLEDLPRGFRRLRA
ncbi:MAG TPA: DUF58 domain-containing protein [Ruania sp.]|nr:DUF58 domain-containing protein [Ruania sp.]